MLKKMKAKLAVLVDKAEAIVAAAGEEGFTAEQRASVDSVKSEIATLNADIKRVEDVQAVERPTITATPAVEKDPMRGFNDEVEFALAVREACIPGGTVDARIAPQAVSSGSSSAGFLVTPQMQTNIWSLVNSEPSIVGLLNVEPTSSTSVEYNADENTPWGGQGIQAYWRGENQQMTATDDELKKRNLKIHELYAFTTATEEILADAPRLRERLTVGSAKAINWKRDLAVVDGDGVGKPKGWTNGGAMISVAKKSGQTAATIVAENVLQMFAQNLNPMNAFWITRPEAIVQLSTMTIGDQPIWMAPSGLMAAPGGLLLGRPVYFTEHCEALGTAGDIQFISPDGYYAAQRSDVKLDESIHLYFDYNKSAFRWVFRFGGAPTLETAVSPSKGAVTRSYTTQVAVRA